MLLSKRDNVEGIFIPVNTDSIAQVWTWVVWTLFVGFFAVVAWNLNYMHNMSSMSQAVIDSYVSTGDAMGQAAYESLVKFEKNNLFSSGFFVLFSFVLSLFALVALFALLLEEHSFSVADVIFSCIFGLAIIGSWTGIVLYSDKSMIEKANAYVFQGKETKTAVIDAFRETTCYSHKHGRSCTQRMEVLIDGQKYELTTPKVDFYKVGQELQVTKEIYLTQLTREKKVNIVY